MRIGIIDIFLVLSLLYLIFSIISNYSNKPEEPTNIIFDDDIIIVNSGNSIELSNIKDVSKENSLKSNFESKVIINEEPKEIMKVEDNVNYKTESIPYMDSRLLAKEIYSEINPLDSMILDKIISPPNNNLNIKNSDKVSNRYNRKLNNVPTEYDLYDIRNYDIVSNDNLYNYDLDAINNNNNETLQKNHDMDSKYFNKSNKSQKLFKDAKTIAGRFTKNSINNDYKYELDYYEKLRTPWWSEDAKYNY